MTGLGLQTGPIPSGCIGILARNPGGISGS